MRKYIDSSLNELSNPASSTDLERKQLSTTLPLQAVLEAIKCLDYNISKLSDFIEQSEITRKLMYFDYNSSAVAAPPVEGEVNPSSKKSKKLTIEDRPKNDQEAKKVGFVNVGKIF